MESKILDWSADIRLETKNKSIKDKIIDWVLSCLEWIKEIKYILLMFFLAWCQWSWNSVNMLWSYWLSNLWAAIWNQIWWWTAWALWAWIWAIGWWHLVSPYSFWVDPYARRQCVRKLLQNQFWQYWDYEICYNPDWSIKSVNLIQQR